MFNREDIVKELNNRGYGAEKQESIKNGEIFEEICIYKDRKDGFVPIIYTKNLIEKAEKLGWNIEKLTDKILEIYKNMGKINITEENLQNRDYVLKHLFIGLQRKSKEFIEKRETQFDEIEQYLYVRSDFKDDGSSYTTKVKKSLLLINGINRSDAWSQAKKNTFNETKICSLSSVLNEQGLVDEEIPLYIVTNDCQMRGASGILNKKRMEDLAKDLGVKIFLIFPSSIHEMIVMPYEKTYKEALLELNNYTRMVIETNSKCIDPCEQLADKAYIMEI